ncbi:muts domain V [Xylaria arbuscula]|nr:muts domain V [Xylaria arbuscula]
MTGSPPCSRLLPLLACRSPCPLSIYDAVGLHALPLAASAARAPAIVSHSRIPAYTRTHTRDFQQRPSLPRLSPFTVSTPGITQSRGKKTRSSCKLDDLPQGLVSAEPLPDVQDDGGPAYPTVVLQARRNMQKFENCILLTRVGGFYELYFEHAEEYGPLLNLKVAQKKTNAGPVSMAGFPFFQLERFLKILVLDFNCYVAVAEEFPNDPSDKVKSGGLMHDRRVARVITPGTLIDENFIDPYANNYVLAIHTEHEACRSSADDGPDLPSPPIGLAWLDISTGQFYTEAASVASLSSVLSRVGPREIVVDDVLESQRDHQLFSVLAEDKHLITFAPGGNFLPLSEWGPMLESDIPLHTLATFTANEAQAGSLLLQYVKDRLQGMCMKLQPPQRHENLAVLAIDKNTMRALEIKQTIKDSGFRGSLLHAVRRTVTKGGARLLDSWLSAPSTCIDTIRARQDLVEYFIQNEDQRDEIIILLRRSHDSQRLVQKFAFGRGDADDLIGLANTIRAVQDIVRTLSRATEIGRTGSQKPGRAGKKKPDVNIGLPAQPASCFASLLSRIKLEEPVKLADRIRTSIDEEGLVQQHQEEANEANQLLGLAQDVIAVEGTQRDTASLPKDSTKKKQPVSIRDYYADDNMAFVMKPEASSGLQELHAKLTGLLQEKVEMATALRDSLGAPSLTLKWTPNLGHICHVKGKDVRAAGVTNHAAVSSSRSTRTFHVAEWTALGQRIHQTRFEIGTEETRIFANLRAGVVANLVKLRGNASVLDELDVTTSFALLATEKGLTRPVLNNSTAHTIIGGRHPTVEGGLREQGRSFTRNDCLVGHATNNAATTSHHASVDGNTSGQDNSISPSDRPAHASEGRLWLITGPNMAGKSTYLRQNALITILAQAGCYVPASHATLGVVDAVFSRVGSADNLYRDQSTFMVEMLETAQILRNATPRSFVIMDEIGRGTTPEDGEAVAFACLHHLATVNRSRTLFATHFHGLADLVREHGLHVSSSSSTGGDTGAVEMYCTDVEEDGAGGFVYVHKLRKGVNRQSHALKVARLAGLPESIIAVAQDILRTRH